MPDTTPTLASTEQAQRDEADRNQQHVGEAVANVHASAINTPDAGISLAHLTDGGAGLAVAPPVAPPADTLEAESLSALKTFNDRFTRIVEIFEDYRAKAQAGKLTADDEKLAGVAIAHARVLVDIHKPLPPLPDLLRNQ